MKLKVKEIGSGSAQLFRARGFEIVDDIDSSDIVVLNGGADIATEIYNQKLISRHVFDEEGQVQLYEDPSFISPRDKMEMIAYTRAKAGNKFVFAICRGAQLVNCMEGGTLWQHVNNHHTTHPIIDVKTGEIYRATSIHHQMMRVPEGGEIIAVASESSFKIDAFEQRKLQPYATKFEEGDDPEIVWFAKSRALCIQGHPEYSPSSLFSDYCFELLGKLYKDGVWEAKTSSRLATL